LIENNNLLMFLICRLYLKITVDNTGTTKYDFTVYSIKKDKYSPLDNSFLWYSFAYL